MTDIKSSFYPRILSLKHINEIHSLLNNHYVENENNTCRLTYSKDYLYWYLKRVPKNFIIGLVYQDDSDSYKLIGLITAIYIDVIINNVAKNVPYISLLCCLLYTSPSPRD